MVCEHGFPAGDMGCKWPFVPLRVVIKRLIGLFRDVNHGLRSWDGHADPEPCLGVLRRFFPECQELKRWRETGQVRSLFFSRSVYLSASRYVVFLL